LASPPLVVAFALAGTVDIDLSTEPIGHAADGRAVLLSELWPSAEEVADTIRASLTSEEFRRRYASVFDGDARWQGVEVPQTVTYAWDASSTYVKQPPFFTDMPTDAPAVHDIAGARVLALLGNSVTTDHISPAGSIRVTSPAGAYLAAHGVAREDWNSYGARRGNHEIMMRGTFANNRLRNLLAPGTEGGVTLHLPGGEECSIFDAAMRYESEGVPLVILAGKEYGTGSSRDWAGKGTALLGVRAVIADSFERIHRSNLVGMGVLPLQFPAGENADSLGLDGHEVYSVEGLASLNDGVAPKEVAVRALRADGSAVEFSARVRIDTPMEAEYYRHGGILHYVLRQLAG
jgi:aconitate hydratase